MHKNPYKHRFIAGSARCSTKPLSILLTELLTHIKQGFQKYCEAAYSKWGESYVDPQKFKGVIGTSEISEFQPYNKHKIF